MKRLLKNLFFVLVVFCSSANADVFIELSKVSDDSLPIAIAPIKAKGEATAATTAELIKQIGRYARLSGLFEVIGSEKFIKNVDAEGYLATEIDFNHYKLLQASLLTKGWVAVKAGQLVGELYAYDVASKRPIVQYRVKGSADDVRLEAKRFINRLLVQITGEPGAFDSSIAFLSDQTGRKELYVLNYDDRAVKQLTNFRSIVQSPAWDPKGKRISFIGFPKGGKKGYPKLFAMRIEGQIVETLASFRASIIAPRWLNEQEMLMTISPHGDPEIYKVHLAKKQRKRLTSRHGIDVSPSLSPDGQAMVFVSSRSGGGPQVFVKPIGGGRAKRVTHEGKYNTSPAWHPKRNLVAYSGRTKDGKQNIFLIKPDGTSLVQLTAAQGNNEAPSWSPDGRRLVFASDRKGKYQLFSMSLNGKNVEQLTTMKGNVTMPVWSPPNRAR